MSIVQSSSVIPTLEEVSPNLNLQPGDWVASYGNPKGAIFLRYQDMVTYDAETNEEIARVPGMVTFSDGVISVTKEQAQVALSHGWFEDQSIIGVPEGIVYIRSDEPRSMDGRIAETNFNISMVSISVEDYDQLIATLKFYADPKSYQQQTLEAARAALGGKDPTISITSGSVHHVARPGFALSPMQHDNDGDKARAMLKILEN